MPPSEQFEMFVTCNLYTSASAAPRTTGKVQASRCFHLLTTRTPLCESLRDSRARFKSSSLGVLALPSFGCSSRALTHGGRLLDSRLRVGAPARQLLRRHARVEMNLALLPLLAPTGSHRRVRYFGNVLQQERTIHSRGFKVQLLQRL